MSDCDGRLLLDTPCWLWMQWGLTDKFSAAGQRTLRQAASAVETPGLSLIPLTPEIAIESSNLPGDFQGDPTDRILVATARGMGAMLLTHDRQLLAYGAARYANIRPA